MPAVRKCSQCSRELVGDAAIDLADIGKVEVFVEAHGKEWGSRVTAFPKEFGVVCEKCEHVIQSRIKTTFRWRQRT